ncbi:XdhC family protein [Candidatus Albibeggiatoa sp. nov. NOAA]|uniref:XdhC family protein n=1 Tax=Candidatus Albibeggiatoa sp. nov. NOAA TaxID=3162724 RepID=UPI0032FCCD22|nr:XdhC family protein [Thiotrichaceae bacterium]
MTDISFGTDREIITTAINWIKAQQRVALVTVVKTWGSSPRPCGSLMVMGGDGQFSGSVSGGCVEDDLLERFRTGELSVTHPMLIDYGVKAGDAARFGLPCGGRLELLIEPLEHAAQMQTLLSKIEAGELMRRQVCLDTGEVSLHPANNIQEFSADEHNINQVFGSAWQLLLIGAGQLARYTARIALMLGYSVTVCDPREMQADWQEQGVNFITTMPDDAVLELANHPRAAVITLAHDPKMDDMALMEALKTQAFYIGALGSRKTSAARRERLTQLDLNETQINRLHAPVGLSIGSKTPPEIALSIMAGITAVRRQIS